MSTDLAGGNPAVQSRLVVVSDLMAPALNAMVVSTSLDMPRMGASAPHAGSLAVVTGWLLKKNPEDKARVILSSASGKSPLELTIKRPDVVQKILKLEPLGSPFLVCGFKVSALLDGALDVLIEINGQAHPWRRIEVHEGSADIDAISSAWLAYCRNRFDGSIKFSSTPGAVDWRVLKARCFKTPQVVVGSDGLERLSGFKAQELPYLRRFAAEACAVEFPAQLVETALSEQQCVVSSPFGSGNATCRESIHYRSNFTALRFVDATGEVFFVMQHVSSADGVYFPMRNAVIQIKHLALSFVEELVQVIVADLPRYAAASLRAGTNAFGGVVASHGRPYHFYYDVAPAMQLLYERGLAQKLPAIVMSEGADFLSFKKLFGLAADERVQSLSNLCGDIAKRGVFYLHAGMLYSDAARPYVDRFDQMLRGAAKHLAGKATLAEAEKARACFPLVWFGVTGQKRAWVEQVDGGVAMLTELAKCFPGLGVVFDGWTAPIKPMPGDAVETSRDLAITEAIRIRLPQKIKTFSVVGATTARKVCFADLVDLFVANSATGSLHVSRFARRPGVGHIGHQMIGHEAFIHYQLKPVAAEHVTDIPDPDHPRIDFTSYSIDWRVMFGMVSEILRAPDFLASRLNFVEMPEDEAN